MNEDSRACAYSTSVGFQRMWLCGSKCLQDFGVDAYSRACFDCDKIHETLEDSDIHSTIHGFAVPLAKEGLILQLWGSRVTSFVHEYASVHDYESHDITSLCADVLLQTLICGQFCPMERLALESSFIGVSVLTPSHPESEAFLVAPALHFEGLGPYGRPKFHVWKLRTNLVPLVFAKVVGLGENPGEDQLEQTAGELRYMYQRLPSCARASVPNVAKSLNSMAKQGSPLEGDVAGALYTRCRIDPFQRTAD